MKKDNKILVQHILNSIAQIEKYTNEVSEELFMSDSKIQDAVLRRLEIIGEAAGNISDDFKKENNDIEWSKATAVRNILIHQYFEVDLKIIWDTVKINLPVLKHELNKLQQEELLFAPEGS